MIKNQITLRLLLIFGSEIRLREQNARVLLPPYLFCTMFVKNRRMIRLPLIPSKIPLGPGQTFGNHPYINDSRFILLGKFAAGHVHNPLCSGISPQHAQFFSKTSCFQRTRRSRQAVEIR